MWGYPVLVLGAISSFLEPFRGRLSPNIDKVPEESTLRYPHEGPWVDDASLGPRQPKWGPALQGYLAHKKPPPP